MRTIAAILLACVGVGLAAQGRPTLEVASIKENRSGRFETFFYRYPSSGRVVAINHWGRLLVQIAHNLRDYQAVGGPKWMDDVRFDIEAKASGPASNAQMMQMLQALLEDKFKLVLHREDRPGTVLALVQATPGKLGPNITPAKPEDARMYPIGLRAPGQGTQGSAATMADLADHLSTAMGRYVVDRTGVTGIYNFTVLSAGAPGLTRLPPGLPADKAPGTRDDFPSLTTALQEQLGLRLVTQQGTVPTYVIDRAERPDVDGYSSTAAPVAVEGPGR
jgi:uncharacterized protein (TIGR03435 family)